MITLNSSMSHQDWQKPKNKITTQGYFIKRLRDSGYTACRIFNGYKIYDPRKWTILVNPENEAIWVTLIQNKQNYGDFYFELNDGGLRFPKNFGINTDSFEVILNFLNEKGITGIWTRNQEKNYNNV